MTWASGSAASRAAGSRPIASLMPGLELGRAAGVQHDVVHAPVVGDDGEAALGDDQEHGDVGAGRADQPTQVAGLGEVVPAVDEQQVGVGRLEKRATFSRKDLEMGRMATRGGPPASVATAVGALTAALRGPHIGTTDHDMGTRATEIPDAHGSVRPY